jgi:hypothetical protein
MRGQGCIVFHDSPVIYRGLADYLAGLRRDGRPFDAYALPSSMFVVELGGARLLAAEPLAQHAREGHRAYFHALSEYEPYRTEYRRIAHRALRRLERAVGDTGALLRRRARR